VRLEAWLYSLASIGNLFMAMLVVFRARRARGALPVALLSLALFTWCLGEAFFRLTREPDPRWKVLALVGSSIAPAFLYHFILLFTRREKLLKTWGAVLYAVSALFTGMTAAAFVDRTLGEWVQSQIWNLTYLALLFPFLIASLLLLRLRHREVESDLERNAINFVSFGIVVGALTGLSDLAKILGNPLPFVGHIGSLGASVVLALAIFRHKLLESETPVLRTLLLLVVATIVVGANVWLFRRLDVESGLTTAGIAIATVAGLAIYRLVLLNWYDASERRRRLALVGTMAAGVAHEIKNPLASIKGAAQLVQAQIREGKAADAGDYLKLLVDEVDRLNGVIEDFLNYARPREPKRRTVELNELVTDVLRLQQTALPAAIAVETRLDPLLPPVQADPDLLKHALINVLRNAIDAMPEGGIVTVSTRSVMSAFRTYAVVSIADTGKGLDLADVETLFQPFFTTKSKGTGLGLPIARRIIESHGGEIAVENVSPRGARFSFYLPYKGF
jgi:signal transduction histidine kinase